jgi:hypothetical protein
MPKDQREPEGKPHEKSNEKLEETPDEKELGRLQWTG